MFAVSFRKSGRRGPSSSENATVVDLKAAPSFNSARSRRFPRQGELSGAPAIPLSCPGSDSAREAVFNLNEYGAPTTIDAGIWFVCFVPGLRRQWWHRLIHRQHKHVFAIRPEPAGTWTLFEPWWRRLLTASISSNQARAYLAWAAAGDVLLARESIPGDGSQIRGWMTCAVLVSFLLGRPYRTWTPHGFYRRLKREAGVGVVDVSMLLAPKAADSELALQMIDSGDRLGIEPSTPEAAGVTIGEPSA